MRTAPLRGQRDAVIIDVYTRIHPTRSYVSADRVHDALRHQLNCIPTGEHGPDGTFWLTPQGMPFEVAQPMADPGAAAVTRASGARQLYYSYAYARSLLRRVIDLCGLQPAPQHHAGATAPLRTLARE